jgi:hypothetical protein
MQADRTERKYVITKLRAGDYLLPSNDAQTIWRLQRYMDGPTAGIMDLPHDQWFWRLLRWAGRLDDFVDVEDWDQWEECACMLGSRTEAVTTALNWE